MLLLSQTTHIVFEDTLELDHNEDAPKKLNPTGKDVRDKVSYFVVYLEINL